MTTPADASPPRSSEALLDRLPPHLLERTRALRGGALPGGEFVLVWLRTSLRATENPALDVALLAADALGVPVLVYQGLSARYPYASDRIHTFILEGARDLHRDLAARGIPSVCHVERSGQDAPALRILAERASLVVTGDFPAPPLTRWTERLRQRVLVPLWAVDTACVVPMQLSGRPYARAYAFRQATEAARDARLGLPWHDVAVSELGAHVVGATVPAELPFDPVDVVGLSDADIAELVASCPIDHTVGPVPHTRGGTDAGMARWTAFRDGGGLDRYHRDRNDAARDGVSRLSPWLHFGMVSPFLVARDAWAREGKGPEKYLDELLVWRELAWHWCHHHEASLSAPFKLLPDWARRTLLAHSTDDRPVLYSWDTLRRSQTDDALWNLAQTSLRVHGELHNNVRMTWGKAVLQWTQGPEEALDVLIDLNHRYALDGRDPSSYGGILWCLGLFDRPFTPEQPVVGSVRGRSTASHARRVGLARYGAVVGRPLRSGVPRVAVVGAGMAGLACARTLKDHGVAVELFDKSRGPGGRMASRRIDGGRITFDHGAQYFTARDPHFARRVRSWVAEGHAARWSGRVGMLVRGVFSPEERPPQRYVGHPRMSALTRHLSTGLPFVSSTRVGRIDGEPGRWQLWDVDGAAVAGHDGATCFDVVVVAVPAPQAVPLLAASPTLQAQAEGARYSPCHAVMATFERPLGLGLDAARVVGSPLLWVARNASKPGRAAAETWVLHAAPEWSRRHLEDDAESVRMRLLTEFATATGCAQRPIWSRAHRWRYALVEAHTGAVCDSLWDAALGIGACGDWTSGPRVESAWLAGASMAGRVLGAWSHGGLAQISRSGAGEQFATQNGHSAR